jgi:hypothetical protein
MEVIGLASAEPEVRVISKDGNMIVEDYIRPAAIKAGVISMRDGGTYDNAGNLIKKFGFRCFRPTLASFLLAQGNNPC